MIKRRLKYNYVLLSRGACVALNVATAAQPQNCPFEVKARIEQKNITTSENNVI